MPWRQDVFGVVFDSYLDFVDDLTAYHRHLNSDVLDRHGLDLREKGAGTRFWILVQTINVNVIAPAQ